MYESVGLVAGFDHDRKSRASLTANRARRATVAGLGRPRLDGRKNHFQSRTESIDVITTSQSGASSCPRFVQDANAPVLQSSALKKGRKCRNLGVLCRSNPLTKAAGGLRNLKSGFDSWPGHKSSTA